MELTKKAVRSLLRRFDAVQVDQLWMKLGSFNFTERDGVMLRLEPLGTGLANREFTWEQLLKARVKNETELVLPDGTRMIFYKLTPIKLDGHEKGRLQH